MKKNLSIILPIVVLIAAFFIVRDPPLDIYNVNEINHSLLGSLDPHLGYAHITDLKSVPNPTHFHFHLSDPDYQILGNGFVKMSYEENKNPIRIGVLGASESDPFFFDGNWPLSLHKELKKLNIPHIIYNGAVSGYNANQVFTKFTRDLMALDKINYLLVYHGAADCPINADTLDDHRDVHPRALLTLQEVTKSYNQANLNWWSHIKSFLLREKYPIQLGVVEKDYVKNYLKNMNFINAIAKDNNIQFMHVQIIYPNNETQIAHDDEIVPPEKDYTDKFVSCLKELSSGLSHSPYSFSFQNKLKPEDKFFYDPMHLTPAGNQMIANEIISRLKLTP